MKTKNNPKNFYKELEKLLGKNVTILVNHPSENFYFSIEGILKNSGYLFLVQTISSRFNLGIVHFSDKMVMDVKNNFINVKLEPSEDILFEINNKSLESYYLNTKQLEHVINKIVIISLPSKLRWSSVIGKLKYNNSKNFYYIQDYNHTLQVRFIREMIFNIKVAENSKQNNMLEILSENINRYMLNL